MRLPDGKRISGTTKIDAESKVGAAKAGGPHRHQETYMDVSEPNQNQASQLLQFERRRADRFHYVANMLQIPALWEQGNYSLVAALLQQTPHTPTDFAWGYWNSRVAAEQIFLHATVRGINAVDFAPDGNKIVLGYEEDK